MHKLTLITLFTFCSLIAFSQQDFLVLKKRNKRVSFFMKDAYITFQMKDRDWVSGYITKVQNDSFFVKRISIRYSLLGTDTVHFGVIPVALSDVYAMPRKGEQVGFEDDRVRITMGDEKWVWVKNGALFMIVGGGYTFLNVTNTLIQGDKPFAHNNIARVAIGTATFLAGLLLHKAYKPFLIMGRKYHLQTIKVSKKATAP